MKRFYSSHLPRRSSQAAPPEMQPNNTPSGQLLRDESRPFLSIAFREPA